MSYEHNTVYQYAVVRFMPFIETREFANIGVVMIAPKTGKFLYRLAPSRFGRVTQFFDDLEGKLYKNAVTGFNAELERIQVYCERKGLRDKKLVEYFSEVTRRRESVLHFGKVGTLMGNTEIFELDKLYQRFVGRDFVNPPYREEQMVKVLKQTFAAQITAKYTHKKLKAGVMDIPMPLVYAGNYGVKVIKPLAFEQNTPLKAYEHGIHWANRVGVLINKGIITPDRALFTLERPITEQMDIAQVYDDVVGEINQLGVQVEEFTNTENIIQFAKVEEQGNRDAVH